MLPAALALMLHNGGAIISFLIGQQVNEIDLRPNVTKKKK